MKVGYVRISTQEQSDDLQIIALKNTDCEKMYSDQIFGSKADRPGLKKACRIHLSW